MDLSSPPPTKLKLRCPPLPETLLDALKLSKHPKRITPEGVTEMLQRDPLAVAWLLQMANSSLHGLRRTISSLDRAVLMLGPVQVVGLVVGMSMLKLRSALSGAAGPTFNRLIRHSVATAHLSQFLIEGLPVQHGQAKPSFAGLGFTAGLLHDFGKIILVYNFQTQAVALYDQYGIGYDVEVAALQERERRLFGCDHSEAGAFASDRLHFPDLLTQTMRLHHHPELMPSGADAKQFVTAVTLADLAARALGHAFTSPRPWLSCVTDEAWAAYLPFAPPPVDTPEKLVDAVQAQREPLDLQVRSFSTSLTA